jgi:signal transduction histidine kinase
VLHKPLPPELKELEKVGDKWLSYVFPSDLPKVSAWFAALGRKGSTESVDYRVVTEDGGLVWIRHSVVCSASKSPARLQGLVRVLNEQKLLETECLRICERERASIGQELHDDICQLLAGLSCMLDVLGRQVAGVRPDLHSQLDELSSQIHGGMERTRALAHGLVPARLVSMGLEKALSELARQTLVSRQVKVDFSHSKGIPSHSNEQILHLYRIAQEAISNAIRHGGATGIELTLRKASGKMLLGIRDNGRGMPSKANRPQGIGMHVMQFRAGILGGSLRITSSPSRGVYVEVSYAPPAAQESSPTCSK